ncbi:MAG: histidine kinase [Acidobacteria bacterium]|nr:histidine kinase [Acidobacteriota bacterium]
MTAALRCDVEGVARRMREEGIAYEDAVNQFKRALIREIVKANSGNQSKAAMEMGAHRNTLSRSMAELGLTLHEVREELRADRKRKLPAQTLARAFRSYQAEKTA